MKKISIFKPGSYDQLKMVECDDLIPQDNQVVVDVHGIGLNYADCLVRFGVYESGKKLIGWPITPGFEFSGVVRSVGSKVSKVKVGDSVFGMNFFFSYATQVCVAEHLLSLVPSGLSLHAMAGFPVVYLTAYYPLKQLVHIRDHSLLLIHSAAGGVGSALVNIAKILGHRTVGVVGSSEKVNYLKNLGCDYVVDKSKGNLESQLRKIAPEGFDAAFDANGYPTLQLSYDLLKPTGKLIFFGSHSLLPRTGGRVNYVKALVGILKTPRFKPLDMITDNKLVAGFNLSFLFDRVDLLNEAHTDFTVWLQQKKIAPLSTQYIPFEECARAHQLIESGKSTGKIVMLTENVRS